MASFTAADVKTLREMTNVGMMDCKKALTAADGDIDKAVEWLREKGLAAAQKKAGRIAAEGMAYAAVVDGIGVIVEVNAESDFVAKNDLFVDYVKGVAAVVAKENPADLDALYACAYGNGKTVLEEQNDKVLVIGENIKVRRFARYDTGLNVPYVHMGGRIAVLVNLETESTGAAVVELGKDIAMIHFKDFLRKDAGGQLAATGAGQGGMEDYRTILRFAKQEKPYIFATLENTTPENAVECLNYLKKQYDEC